MRGADGTSGVGRAMGVRRPRAAACAVLAALLTAAGCGNGSEPDGSRTGGSGASRPESASPRWEFEHIADFSGGFTDVAALGEDDIWAVGTENNGASNAHLLHYDGERWKREPLPEALGDTDYPPVLEEIGDDTLWLRPQKYATGDGVTPWVRWDGVRWSAVPNPPPGNVGDLEAAGPRDIWALTGERTAVHFDGSRWTTTRLPHRTVDLAVAGPDDVWAVGSRSTGPGTEQVHGEPYDQPASSHWDGTSWQQVETPQSRFDEPLPPEPGAGLLKVFALADGEVRAYGNNTFNHGEVEDEPQEEFIRLRRADDRWVEQEQAPGGCALRVPVAQDDEGLFLDGNWFLHDDGRCLKIKRHRLPVSTGARKDSGQTLWLEEIHRVPGTDTWLGAGKVQVTQSGDPFGAPVLVRLKRAA
ncbi:hypothetical protein [Streptomyces alfalfae]|uniref:Exo-alpha-sialidase n=1 Tax=Streptomyces alfalfae TaxID=1642299 RepID=A0A7T4U0Z3_9ACTN|nr:hypothetical protein [Streptomyces alfalfae]QQC91952.1 hypothetical protein I8755_28805 [Streptomyces alfalfae]